MATQQCPCGSSMALLKILALGNRQIEVGKPEPAANVVRRLKQVRKAG